MLAVVPDATVLVSAAISRAGNPDRINRAWQEGELTLIVCPRLLEEVRTVLRRPRLRRYVSLDEAEEYVELLRTTADVRDDPESIERVVAADPNDDYLFGLAHEAGASYIVSGDKHVLAVKSAHLGVLTPAQLVAELERQRRVTDSPSSR